jgi:uncharacterized protein YkwD
MMKFAGLGFAAAWFLAVFCQTGAAAPPYRAYAEELTRNPPQSVVIRPDLETLLDSLAANARLSQKRNPAISSPQFKTLARAQAIDMVLGDYVGHQSLKGYSFRARFAAFADNPDLYPARGENAARERSDGPADEAKTRRLFDQWLRSGGHRRNLLSRSYDHMSTGVVQKGGHLYAVQIFWRVKPDTAEGGSGAEVCKLWLWGKCL